MIDRQWNRCDVCGRFIGFKELEDGSARITMIKPDSDVSYETWEKLCKKHNDRPTKREGEG